MVIGLLAGSSNKEHWEDRNRDLDQIWWDMELGNGRVGWVKPEDAGFDYFFEANFDGESKDLSGFPQSAALSFEAQSPLLLGVKRWQVFLTDIVSLTQGEQRPYPSNLNHFGTVPGALFK